MLATAVNNGTIKIHRSAELFPFFLGAMLLSGLVLRAEEEEGDLNRTIYVPGRDGESNFLISFPLGVTDYIWYVRSTLPAHL